MLQELMNLVLLEPRDSHRGICLPRETEQQSMHARVSDLTQSLVHGSKSFESCLVAAFGEHADSSSATVLVVLELLEAFLDLLLESFLVSARCEEAHTEGLGF